MNTLLIIIAAIATFAAFRWLLKRVDKKRRIFLSDEIPHAHIEIHKVVDGKEVLGKELDFIAELESRYTGSNPHVGYVKSLLRSKKGQYILIEYDVFFPRKRIRHTAISLIEETEARRFFEGDVGRYKELFNEPERV